MSYFKISSAIQMSVPVAVARMQMAQPGPTLVAAALGQHMDAREDLIEKAIKEEDLQDRMEALIEERDMETQALLQEAQEAVMRRRIDHEGMLASVDPDDLGEELMHVLGAVKTSEQVSMHEDDVDALFAGGRRGEWKHGQHGRFHLPGNAGSATIMPGDPEFGDLRKLLRGVKGGLAGGTLGGLATMGAAAAGRKWGNRSKILAGLGKLTDNHRTLMSLGGALAGTSLGSGTTGRYYKVDLPGPVAEPTKVLGFKVAHVKQADVTNAALVGYETPNGMQETFLEDRTPTWKDRFRRAGIGGGAAAAGVGLLGAGAMRAVHGPGMAGWKYLLPAAAGLVGGALAGAIVPTPVRRAYDPDYGTELSRREENRASAILQNLKPGDAEGNIAYTGPGSAPINARPFGGTAPGFAYAADVDDMVKEDPSAASFLTGPDMMAPSMEDAFAADPIGEETVPDYWDSYGKSSAIKRCGDKVKKRMMGEKKESAFRTMSLRDAYDQHPQLQEDMSLRDFRRAVKAQEYGEEGGRVSAGPWKDRVEVKNMPSLGKGIATVGGVIGGATAGTMGSEWLARKLLKNEIGRAALVTGGLLGGGIAGGLLGDAVVPTRVGVTTTKLAGAPEDKVPSERRHFRNLQTRGTKSVWRKLQEGSRVAADKDKEVR